MPSDTKNVKLGVCAISFGGADLGYTKGGVEVEVTTETHEVEVDQFGKGPVDEVIMGRMVTVKVPLAETTLENLVAIMPGATLVTDKTVTTKKKVVVSKAIGQSLLAIAKQLVLHPIANAVSNKADDFTVPLAATAGAINFAYKLDEERIFNVTFKGYPDATSGLLFVVGDPAATAV